MLNLPFATFPAQPDEPMHVRPADTIPTHDSKALRKACIEWVNHLRCRPLSPAEDPDACLESFAAHFVQSFRLRVDEILVAPNPTIALEWSERALNHQLGRPRGRDLNKFIDDALWNEDFAVYSSAPKGDKRLYNLIMESMQHIGPEDPLLWAYCSIFENRLLDLNQSPQIECLGRMPMRQNELFLGRLLFLKRIYPLSFLAQHRQQLNRWDGLLGLLRFAPCLLKAGKTLVLSRPPLVLHRNEQGILHHVEGPALRFEEGDNFCFLHGIRVTRELVEGLINERAIHRIAAVPDRQLRIALIRHIGFERFARASSAERVQSDACGSIFHVTHPDAPSVLSFLVRAPDPEDTGLKAGSVHEIPFDCKTARKAWNSIASQKETPLPRLFPTFC